MLTELLIIAGLIVLLLVIAYFYLIYAPVPTEPKQLSAIKNGNIRMGEHDRHYLAYVPQSLKPKPGVIVALHGSGMASAVMRKWTGYELDRLAEERGFIVIYPDAYKGNWNDCRKDSPFKARLENIDDVAFISRLVKEFSESLNIDLEKVFVFGFSNGGQMAFRLAAEKPELFRAICVISANLPTPETCLCSFDTHMPRTLLITGTADKINPYGGGAVKLFGLKKIGTVRSAAATAQDIAKGKHLDHAPELYEDASLRYTRLSYKRLGVGEVELITMTGGGHVIPQPLFKFPRLMGTTNPHVNSPKLAVDFFGI